MSMQDQIKPKFPLRRIAGWMLGALLIGYPAGKLAAYYVNNAGEAGPDWSFFAAMCVACIYGALALLTVLLGALPKFAAQMEEGAELQDVLDDRPKMLICAIACLGFCVSLAVAALGGSDGTIDHGLAIALFAGSIVIGIWSWIWSTKHLDEMDWQLSNEACVITFYMLFAIGGSWAALAQFGLISAPDPLDWLTMLWGFSFPAAIIAYWRRGLLQD